ncbi:hypothetical protein [Streptomyces sp. NPDC051567]|uniref:hypothetical protein n=1 Tax=Streptomyces sp. NPDC051567 TaxID=3365660 RepID=UPI0037A71B1C
MSTVSHSRRTFVRAAAVAVCAGGLLALPAGVALAEGVPAASASQRVLVKTLSLADGVSTAKVYRIAPGVHQADILTADGIKAASLTSRDGVTGFGGAGDLHAALRPDGRLSSWLGEAPAPGGGHAIDGGGFKTGTRGGPDPAGALTSADAGTGDGRALAAGTAGALRLDTLADGEGEGVLLLAAGGGIAAVGAAGLGFAMLRRGRTDG